MGLKMLHYWYLFLLLNLAYFWPIFILVNMVYRSAFESVTNVSFMQVHYPSEAIQNVPFFESKLQLLEAQVSCHHVCNILFKSSVIYTPWDIITVSL